MAMKKFTALIIISLLSLFPLVCAHGMNSYILNEDFNWDLGKIVYDSVSDNYGLKNGVTFGFESNGTEVMDAYVDEINGDKFVAFSVNTMSKNGGIGIDLGYKLTSGEIIYDLDVKADVDSGCVMNFGQYWGYKLGTSNVGWRSGQPSYNTFSNWETDENGFYHLRFVLNKTPYADGKSIVTVTVSDRFDPENRYVSTQTVKTGESDNKIESISFGKIYTNTSKGGKIYISRACVYERKTVEITDFSYNEAENLLEFTSAEAINIKTAKFYDGNAYIDGEIVRTDLGNNKIYIRPKMYLIPQSDYTLTVEGVSLVSGEECSKMVEYAFVMPDYNVPLTLLSSSPANKSRIKSDAGSIDLQFSAAINVDDLTANTMFVNEQTNDNVPFSIVRTGEKTVTLSYDRLENNSTYQLCISDNLLIESVTYEYYTTGSNRLTHYLPSSAEIGSCEGQIRLSFENEITKDTAEKYITFFDKTADQKENFTVSSINGEIILWIPKLIVGNEYSIVVSDEILEEKAEILYTAVETGEVSSVIPAGGVIGINQKTIELLFDTEQNISDLENEIKLFDDNMVAPKGGIYIKKDSENPCKAVVSFGRLNVNTGYHLSVGSDLMYHYNTNSGYIIDDDFSGWELGKVNIPSIAARVFSYNKLTFGHAENTLATSYYEIAENPDGTKYLSFRNTQKNNNNSVGFVFSDNLYQGNLVVEIGVKAGNSVVSFMNSAVDIGPYWGDEPGSGSVKMTSITVRPHNIKAFGEDEYGYNNIRIEYEKTPFNGSSSTIKTSFYDMTNEENVLKQTIGFTANESVNYIKSVSFAKLYSNEDVNDTVNLSFVRAYFPENVSVINNLDGFLPENHTIELVFSDDINETSLKNNGIVITNGDKTIKTELVSYCDRKAVLKLSEHLDYSQNYEIVFNGLLSDGDFKAVFGKNASFKTADNPISIKSENVEQENGKITLKLALKNETAQYRTITAALMLFDANGAACDTLIRDYDILPFSSIDDISLPISEDSYSNYKTYIWDTTNRYIPIK